MRLYEIFDHREPINWRLSNGMYFGDFSYNDIDFSITLDVKVTPIENKDYTIVNVGFGMNDGRDNLYMGKSNLSDRDSLKIMSTACNGINDKLKDNHVDFIIVGSSSNERKELNSRMNIYNAMVQKLGNGWKVHENLPYSSGRATLLSLPTIKDDVIDLVINYIKSQTK